MIRSSKKDIARIIALVAVTVGCNSTSVYAQMVDYGSAQSLFGEPITTSATGTPQRASDVPANMTIITADEIRQSGSRNIPEALQRVPGLDIMRSSTQAYDVGVRGYNQGFQPRLLVLLNGRQIFLDDYSRTDWNAIPVNIDDIRQIEVVKGPNAALFGNNAMGGVINIITYNPLYDKVNVANATIGTQNNKEGSTTLTEKLGDWGGIKVSAGGLNNQEFDTPRSAEESNVTLTPSRRFASADGVFQLTRSTQGELEGSYVKSQDSGASLSNLLAGSVQENSSFKGMLVSQTDYGLIKATSYWNHVRSVEVIPESPSQSYNLDLDNDLVVAQLEDQFRIGANHTFRVSGEYRYSYFELIAPQYEAQSPESQINTFSASAMWNWQMLKDVNFTNAVRVDQRQQSEVGTLWANDLYNAGNYKTNITGINANSGLVWKATDIDTFRLTYGRGVQYPSFYETGQVATANIGGGNIYGFQADPQLNPVIVTNYELDYDKDISPLYSTIRSGLFYTDNKNLVGGALLPGSPYNHVAFINGKLVDFLYNANVGGSRADGIEVGINGKKDGFRWGGSYSFAKVTDEPAVLTYVHYQNSSPQNSFKANLGYSWKQWEFDGFGSYVSSRETLRNVVIGAAPVVVDTDGYSSISGRIGYNINDNFTVSLSGTGLNRQYFDTTGYPDIERQIFLGLTGKF